MHPTPEWGRGGAGAITRQRQVHTDRAIAPGGISSTRPAWPARLIESPPVQWKHHQSGRTRP